MTAADIQKRIIATFLANVKGKKADTSKANAGHDGKGGHWLEDAMGLTRNGKNAPDFEGYEMKNHTGSKTSFGDWSANYYIYRDKAYGIKRADFLRIFGCPNPEKENRHSWSGSPTPKVNAYNRFGQILKIDDENNILALYSYSKDQRPDKSKIVPESMQKEELVIAMWKVDSIRLKVERKFNQLGWFKCIKDKKTGLYTSIVFGAPITFAKWIADVKTGEVFFDSGMYDGNSRPYANWRAINSYWDKLVTERF